MKKITSENELTYIADTIRGFRHMHVCIEKCGYHLHDERTFYDRTYKCNNESTDVIKFINLKLEEI